ncbi:hypothetical protein FHS29_004824 [Saccharothrix tamanrassetensis]|uniref:Uncharacterized protein n=1 Tax=Saccharothrix tamanrassetensis TaxID=1051531 RepID=A0A841CRW2_9PSEU|nr:hypothetical protein [Saccharothrix tamanrassetensis]MBB5958216.1 hypothetical protein [Saccharothrix tamanrassetensis]
MLVEIRIVLTAPGEADLAGTVLENLGQRLNGLPGITWVIREKPPGFSRPFGNARFLLDIVLSSEDKVVIMAEAVEGWLRDRSPGLVLRATAMTTFVDLSFPSSPDPPAALILHLVQEAWESLRNEKKRANFRELLRGGYALPERPDFSSDVAAGTAGPRVHNHLVTNSGNAVQAGAIHGDLNIYTSSESPTQHNVPIIVSIGYKASSSSGVIDGFGGPVPGITDDIGIVVLVEGRSSQAVVLLAIRPVVVDFRDEPEPLLSMISSRDFGIDLTPIPPLPPRVVAHGHDFPFAVAAGDPELFHFTFSVRPECCVSWRLELDWVSAGRTGTVMIPEGGAFTIPSG